MNLRDPEIRRVVRFLIVGGAFSLIYSVTTAALISVLQYSAFWISVVVYAFFIPFAFMLQKTFVFEHAGDRLRTFLPYAALQVATVALVSCVTTLYVTHIFFWDSIIMLVTTGVAAVVNYFISRFVVFAKEIG